MSGILDGVRVLDFGRYIAGPFCATLLADLGADVIRVERPSGGEDRYTVPVTDEGEGAYFMQVGRNKRAITLNPMKPEGQEVVKRLVQKADVVIVNLPPQALKKMGLDYESLCAIKPDIILTTASAYGSTGPYAPRGGFDTIAQAMSGAMYLSGDDEKPGKSFAPYCDFGTATLSAFGTVAALMHKQKTGEGQVVEASLLATSLAFNNAALIEESILGLNRTGSGTRGQYNAPTDSFKTTDGWITIQIVGHGLFKRWVDLIDAPELLKDERFATDQGRGDHGEIIAGYMRQWVSSRSSEQALNELAKAGIPGGELLSPKQVLINEHVVQAQLLETVEYADTGVQAPIAKHPLNYSKSSVDAFTSAPTLSQHTEDVLQELEFSAQDIVNLRELNII